MSSAPIHPASAITHPGSPGEPPASHRDTYRTGIMGEDLVRDELRQRGWSILDVRYRTSWGEIDLVARRRGTIAFVEVKTARPTRVDPFAAVSRRSRHRIRRSAVAWIALHDRYQHNVVRYRFDVAMVHLDASGAAQEIEIIQNAF